MMRSTNRPLSQYALSKCTQEQLTFAAGLFCRTWNKIFIQKYQDLGFYILDNTRQRNVSQNFGTNCHLNKFLKFLDFMCTACKFSMISHHTLFPQRDKQRFRQLYIGVGILNTLTKCQKRGYCHQTGINTDSGLLLSNFRYQKSLPGLEMELRATCSAVLHPIIRVGRFNFHYSHQATSNRPPLLSNEQWQLTGIGRNL